jgi:broad specificity phosphatase PhoE
MSPLPEQGTTASPDIIYIIRHGEKPADPPAVASGQTPPAPAPPFGVDSQGNENPHSLLPRGWQRSGALAVLFDPATGPLQAALQTPDALLSPDYGSADKTAGHRTHETIQALSDRLGLAIVSAYAEGDEPALAAAVVSQNSGVVLICWEHDHIPALASSLPTVTGTVIPSPWPGDRFDVIWAFMLAPGTAPPQYTFTQIPQQLLSGDTDTVISA